MMQEDLIEELRTVVHRFQEDGISDSELRAGISQVASDVTGHTLKELIEKRRAGVDFDDLAERVIKLCEFGILDVSPEPEVNLKVTLFIRNLLSGLLVTMGHHIRSAVGGAGYYLGTFNAKEKSGENQAEINHYEMIRADGLERLARLIADNIDAHKKVSNPVIREMSSLEKETMKSLKSSLLRDFPKE